MSFILDALRKSESERQRDTQPNLSRMPSAIEPPRLPAWAAGAMALLALAVIGLGSAWWFSERTAGSSLAPPAEAASRTAKAPSAGAAEESAAASPIRHAGTAAPRKSATRSGPASTSSGPAARSRSKPTGLESPTTHTEPAAETAAPGSTFESIGSSRTPAGASSIGSRALPPAAKFLPSYADAAAGDPSMPELKLQLHAYYDDPAHSFVFINGEKYAEGDTLKEGPRLIRITERGAVLALNGRQFLLARP
ncbi:MAG TPA: general secretion pathway protein GspB [Gammaproteobacteria bacterium]|nr:general secretion pathway protein GspB [Gammaproteobacteria bacterium]